MASCTTDYGWIASLDIQARWHLVQADHCELPALWLIVKHKSLAMIPSAKHKQLPESTESAPLTNYHESSVVISAAHKMASWCSADAHLLPALLGPGN